ncbi:MAG: hypothetical protein HYT40_01360, partial [Candidatus Sungbacteria bacterium]|nr:hypothetical protein [Candidatus Sungbacteria bacterium]
MKKAAKEFVKPKTALANYQFVPTGGQLVVGTEAIVTSAAAAATEGINVGSWNGTLADDNFQWVATTTASGIDIQLILGGAQLNGANKLIIQTEIDIDSAATALAIQICDWSDATSVDNAEDAQCTGGGWRTLNTKNASQAAVTWTSVTPTALQWHIYNGYWSTGTTGGSAVNTPLSNFVNGSNQIRIRYFSTDSTISQVAVDYLRVYAVVDPIYSPGDFVNQGSGTAAGHYGNANVVGNTASAQQTTTGDAVHLQVPGTAGSVADFYLKFKNIKTYTGMNTILVATDTSCSAATNGLQYRFAVRNFTTSSWEDISSSIDCYATDVFYQFAKNNVTISNYINGSSEIWIRGYGLANSTTNLRLDQMYVMLGTTNTDSASCEISFGSNSSGRMASNPSSPYADQFTAVAIDSTSMYLGGYDTAGGDNEWRVEKRNLSDGALNTSFGNSGIVTSDPSTGSDQILAIATTSDAIFLGGFDSTQTNNQWRVEKRDITTGALVTAFAQNGVLILNPSANQDRIYGIAVDAASLYIAGEDRTPATANAQWRIQKHDITTGATTTAFGTNGVLYNNSGSSNDIPYAVAVDSSSIYIAGVASSTSQGTLGWKVEKHDITTGATTTAFDTDGVWEMDPSTGALDEIRAMSIDGTSIYLAGMDSMPGGATPAQWRIQKHDITTGATTTAFSGDGAITYNGGADNDWVTSLAFDGTNLYAAGFNDDDAGTMQILAYDNTTGATTTAFDADGIVLAEDGGDDRFNAVAVVGSNLFMGGWGSGTPTANNQWVIEKRDSSTGLLVTSGFGANTCADTRNIDSTATSTINFWNLQTEDESSNMSHAYYPMDTDADAVVEEAASANIPFSVTAPSNGTITGLMFAGRQMAGASGATAATVQLGIQDFSGLTSTIGGWSAVGSANTVAMVYTDNVTVGGVASGGLAGWMTNPEDHIDTVNNKMNVRLRTTIDGPTAMNTAAMWDFAMVSLQWAET